MFVPKDYILKAASQPEHLFINSNGDWCLSYRNLPLKVGVSCYVIWQEKILLLLRSPAVRFSGKWGTVSGYVDNLELLHNSNDFGRDHIIQEFIEEVGWVVDESMNLRYGGTHALMLPESQVHFELFTLVFEQEPPVIRLNVEHSAYQWVELSQLSRFKSVLITQFVEGLEGCITSELGG